MLRASTFSAKIWYPQRKYLMQLCDFTYMTLAVGTKNVVPAREVIYRQTNMY